MDGTVGLQWRHYLWKLCAVTTVPCAASRNTRPSREMEIAFTLRSVEVKVTKFLTINLQVKVKINITTFDIVYCEEARGREIY